MVQIATANITKDILGLAISLGKQPTLKEYNEQGKYATGTVKNRFGSWTAALDSLEITESNGFPENRRYIHTEDELCAELKSLEESHGIVTTQVVREHSDYSIKVYQNRFGSWNKALEDCGCETFETAHASKSELTHAVRGVGQMINRRPKSKDFLEHTHYHMRTVLKHFDTYDDFVEHAGFLPAWPTVECEYCGTEVTRSRSKVERSEHNFCSNECCGKFIAKQRGWDGETYQGYGPLFDEQRELAIERDGGRCQSCGMTQIESIEQLGRELTVHHISRTYWPDRPERHHELSNLVTLCNSCHPKWEGLPVRPKLITDGDT